MTADRVTSLWVSGYTRGLPRGLREERAAEIASDVWEHRQAAGDGVGTELAIVSRALRGAGADLSWRRAQRRGLGLRVGLRPVLHILGWTAAAVSYAVVIGIHGWAATRLIGFELYGEDWAPGDAQLYARISGVLLSLLIGGAALVPRLPVLGAMLVAAGLFAQLVVFWWATPILLPLGLAIGAATVVAAQRCERARQARASSAAS